MADKRTREIRRQTRLQARQERLMAKDMRRVLIAFAKDVAAKPTKANLTKQATAHRTSVEKALRRRLLIAALLFGSDALASINTRKSAGELFQIKEVSATFESDIARWLRRHAATRAAQITETFRKWLGDLIADGFEAGVGEKEIAREINKKAPKMSRSRAQTIARTETHTGSQRGALEAAKASTIDLVKEWGSAEDQRVRHTHADADGQIVRDLDDPFLVGDSELLYPGDENGEAKEIINCRCIALYHPIIDGEILR